MALIFVTGVPGSGKSTVEQRLKKLGYDAYDADSIGAAYNIASDSIVKIPPAEERTPQWFQEHQWRVQPERVAQLKHEAKDKPVFLCGTASNEESLWDFFDQVFVLHVDEATLKHRIASRTDNDYGKNQHELEEILRRHKESVRTHTLPRVTVVDANQPLDAVVAAVLGGLAA